MPPTMIKGDCHDCGAKPGAFHKPGCDNEACPNCGFQLISCGCTQDKETAAWIEKRLIPWSGLHSGAEEAAELDLWSKWVPNKQFERDMEAFGLEKALERLGPLPSGHWEICTSDDPDARPDVDRVHLLCVWDREKRRFVKESAGEVAR